MQRYLVQGIDGIQLSFRSLLEEGLVVRESRPGWLLVDSHAESVSGLFRQLERAGVGPWGGRYQRHMNLSRFREMFASNRRLMRLLEAKVVVVYFK